MAVDLKNSVQHLTDEDLVQLIIEQSCDECIAELYNRYLNRIYRKSLSFVKRTSLAEDITHDIFLKILLSLSSFKGKSKFSTWVYSITYNYCIDYIRKRNKNAFIVSDKDTELKDTEDVHDDWNETLEMKASRLHKLLDEISLEDKTILLMKYQEDLSIKDIQEIFDISESATKMRIKRAKEKVQMLYIKEYKEYV